jgi:hypothetical protein
MSSIETFLGGGAPSRRELSMIAVQARTVPGNAVATQEGFFEEASRLHAMFPHAQLLLYPELHLSGLAPLGGSQGGSIALPDEPIPGPLTSRLCDLARTLGIWLVPGSLVERAADGAIYNTAIAINPAGEIVARYRKVFPWRPWEKAAAGAEFTVFDMPGIGRVGLMICYDGWFPEVARQLAWMGAEVILQPSATTTVDRPQEIVLARAKRDREPGLRGERELQRPARSRGIGRVRSGATGPSPGGRERRGHPAQPQPRQRRPRPDARLDRARIEAARPVRGRGTGPPPPDVPRRCSRQARGAREGNAPRWRVKRRAASSPGIEHPYQIRA